MSFFILKTQFVFSFEMSCFYAFRVNNRITRRKYELASVTLEERRRHSSSGYSLASHRGGPGSRPGLVKWDLW
jgi:hypothetical protein